MKLFTPDTSTIDSYYDKGVFLLAWRISMAFLLVFVALTSIFVLGKNGSAALPAAFVILVTIFCLFYLKRTNNYKTLFWIYAISGTILANFAMNFVLDYTHYVDFIWIIACVLISFIGLGWRHGIIIMIANAIGIAYFFWFTLNKHIEVLVPKTPLEILADYIEMLFALFVIAFLMRQFILFQTYSEKKLSRVNQHLEKQNQLILSKNRENETLVKEVHHRVKNNLQIIVSLLRMQSSELTSDESKTHFSEAINRIMAMSLIHERLYGEKELSKINLKSYLQDLAGKVISVSYDKKKVNLVVNTDILHVNLDLIVPFGLLINELVSNSLKHAFINKEIGTITIDIKNELDNYILNYSDDGTWKEPEINQTSFGFELIDILTEQMNGQKTLEIANGSHYHFFLKDPTNN